MGTRTYQSVIGEIRANLARIGMSQMELGKRAGITQSTMSRRMLGETPFTLPELYDICEVLDIPAHVLLREAEGRVPEPRAGGTHEYHAPLTGVVVDLDTYRLERAA